MICVSVCGDEEGNLVCDEAGISQFCHLFSEEPSEKRKNSVYRKENLEMVSLYQKIYGLSNAIFATTFCYLMCQYLLSYIIFQIYLTARVP